MGELMAVNSFSVVKGTAGAGDQAGRGVAAPGSRHDRLLTAAAGLFAERGYHSVTLNDIGSAAGITGPGIYRHFRSKESLLGELLVDVSEHLLSGARDLVRGASGPAEALVALVDFHAGFAVENPALITLQSRELASLAPDHQDRVRRLQHTYVELWATTIAAAGTFSGLEEATVSAHAVFGLLNSTPFSRHLDRGRTRTLLRSLALAALLPEPR